MRIKSLLHLVVVLLLGQFLFSCSSAEYYKFTPDKAEAYNTVKQKPAPEVAEVEEVSPSVAEIALAANEEEEAANLAEPVLEANLKAAPAVTPRKSAAVVEAPAVKEEVKLAEREMTVEEAEALAMAKERLADMTKAEKKELKKEMKEMMRQGGSRTSVVEIILAILLPPLAVFLHDGIGTSFWINIILTLLFVLPGIIHALLVVTDTI
ncbi:YqaE/Pmp3 family membrane protein [Pontibacter anaerobius]|uniref:YqaE/Pmp3 family membrane protein n=1 Tax=Pontibacter anaerobius TaxID=2993940 RepID=UPI003F723ABA